MGYIGLVLQYELFTREGLNGSRIVSDVGAGYNLTCDHFSTAGDDSPPLTDDYCFVVESPAKGNYECVGYLDPNTTRKSAQGERRIYSRNADGEQVAEVWLKNNGDVVVDNGSGTMTLQADGTINLNGVIIDPDGNISAPGTMDAEGTITGGAVQTAAGVDLDTHPHGPGSYSNGGGSVGGTSGAPIPGG